MSSHATSSSSSSPSLAAGTPEAAAANVIWLVQTHPGPFFTAFFTHSLDQAPQLAHLLTSEDTVCPVKRDS